MLSRPLKITLGIGSSLAMLATIIAVNARRSWLPVTVDFGASVSNSSQSYLPTAWRGNELWLLGGTAETVLNSGKADPTPWRIVRNWNRSPLPIVQKALRDNDVVALNPTNADFARSDGANLDRRLQIWRGQALTRHLKDLGHRNSSGLMNAERPTLFSFSPDGTRLIASSQLYGYSDSNDASTGFCTYGQVLFDAFSGKQIERQSAVDGCVTDFSWSPDSKEVAAIAADGWVFILDGQSGKLRLKFRAHQVFGGQIAWSPDGKTLVTATNPRLGQAPTGVGFASVGSFAMQSSPGTGTVSQGKRVLTQKLNGDFTFNGHTERLLKRFDARTGEQIGSALSLQTGVVDMAFSPDGRQLALGEHEFALILNADTLASERHLNVSPTAPAGSIQAPVCVAWSPDSATLATSTARGLTLWRMR